VENLDRTEEQQQYDADDDANSDHDACSLMDADDVASSSSTLSTRPLMPMTRTFCPLRTGSAHCANQRSPCTKTLPRPSKSFSAVPTSPIISSRPLTMRVRFELIPNQLMACTTRPPVAPSAAMTGTGMPKPGTSVSMRITE